MPQKLRLLRFAIAHVLGQTPTDAPSSQEKRTSAEIFKHSLKTTTGNTQKALCAATLHYGTPTASEAAAEVLCSGHLRSGADEFISEMWACH